MAKIQLPKGMSGYVAGNAVYYVGSDTSKFSGSDTAHETIEWDSATTVGISVAIEYGLLRLETGGITNKTGKGSFGFSARWRISYGDNGLTLKPDGKQPKILGSVQSEGDIVVSVGADASQSDAGEKTAYVELSFVPVIGFEDDGLEVGLELGPISAARSVGKTKGTVSQQITFRVELRSERPAAPKPVARIPSDVLTPDAVYFDCGEPTKDGLKALNGWFHKVRDHDGGYLRTTIQLGQVPIALQAYPKGDKKEAGAMIARVKKDLQSGRYFGSSKLKFEESTGAKAREARLEISIDGGRATKAVQKLVSG